MKHLAKRERLYLVCLLLCASTLPSFAQNTDFRVIHTAGHASSDPFKSPGVLADGTLYVSGQGSNKHDGTRPANFPDQVAQALSNVQGVLRDAGMDFSNIVWMNIYLTKAEDIAAADDVYWKTIGENHPARTVLTVANLPNGDRIEINCIAVANTLPRLAIWPEGWPRNPHRDPPAILAGEMLYLSAQGGHDPVTGRPAPNFSAEVGQALENVSTIMKAAHMSMKNVVWVNPYMSVSGQYDVMGKIYATYFEFGNTPGRGTIQIMGLPHNDHIVFSCIAGSDLNKRKAVRPRNMPPSPTASPGILYGDTLYLSAKDGFIPDQGLVTPDLVLQVRQSMRNLLDGLQEANMDFSSVVSSTIYMREIKDAEKEDEIYGKFFQNSYPAQSVLQQSFSPNEEAAEQISVIAVRHKHNDPNPKDRNSTPQ